MFDDPILAQRDAVEELQGIAGPSDAPMGPGPVGSMSRERKKPGGIKETAGAEGSAEIAPGTPLLAHHKAVWFNELKEHSFQAEE